MSSSRRWFDSCSFHPSYLCAVSRVVSNLTHAAFPFHSLIDTNLSNKSDLTHAASLHSWLRFAIHCWIILKNEKTAAARLEQQTLGIIGGNSTYQPRCHPTTWMSSQQRIPCSYVITSTGLHFEVFWYSLELVDPYNWTCLNRTDVTWKESSIDCSLLSFSRH